MFPRNCYTVFCLLSREQFSTRSESSVSRFRSLHACMYKVNLRIFIDVFLYLLRILYSLIKFKLPLALEGDTLINAND